VNRSITMLRRNPAHANRCTEILGLPNLDWTDVQVEFGTDNFAIARVGIILTSEQLVALATLATEACPA
jgi:hypothetical protein